MASLNIRPYTIRIPEQDLADLKRRLAATRWPERETVPDWSQGVPIHILQDLCSYWRNSYDWRRCENWLNESGQHMASIDGLDIQFLHLKSPHANALPMLMIHGWPGSLIELRQVAGPLVNPTAHGGDAKDAFDLVLPSLPGYGFSSKPTHPGTNLQRMSKIFTELMEGLGYKYWVAQGGDWGADIAALLASDHPPESLAGIHLSTLFFDVRKEISRSKQLTEAEKTALAKDEFFEKFEYGYFKLQATRPQTIGYSLADSPVGQLSWILEKLHAWSDRRGIDGEVFSNDDILDNIMMYWLTNTGASSARLYWQDDDNTALPIDIPVGVTIFPGEHATGPQSWCERYYSNIVHFNQVERGGHFAAWEVPDIFVNEMRTCFAKLRR